MNSRKQMGWYLRGALVWALLFNTHYGLAAPPLRTSQVTIANGVLEGVISADDKVRTFKGIPYAAAPVGPLRWKPPQPVTAWTGVRRASEYGARCMQGRIYSDMIFHDDGPSEDCLYLNLWMPAHPTTNRLPVMFWIHGGGFVAGSSSEPRQDGGNLSKQGVLVVSLNYRLGIFGFFSHPELTKESEHHASGNYGLLDQVAALHWVHENIAAFGGDPGNVTIFGESAGSSSVSALVASPLAKGLFRRAIGESGSVLNASRPLKSLNESEEINVKFVQSALGTSSLEALRAKPADEILQAALKAGKEVRFPPNVDGYFFPDSPYSIYSKGKQAHVALLAGWNADEGSYKTILDGETPTPANFASKVRTLFENHADEVLKLYPAATDQQAKRSAQDLAGDQFTGYSTWKWIELQKQTGHSPVFRYQFDQAPPNNDPTQEATAYHSAEIEFVFSVLSHNSHPWRPEDRKVSELMSTYWANFAKTGDPNGSGLPKWPAYSDKDGFQVMHFSSESQAVPDLHRARYEFLDRLGPYK